MPGTTLRFTIISYESARFYFKYIRKYQLDAVVLDEVHKLKNPNSRQGNRIFRAIRSITYRIGLTGTDIEQSVIDLFGQWRAINPNLLGENFKIFRQEYCYRTGYMGYKLKIDKLNSRRVLELLAPYTFKLEDKDVFGVTVLPPVYLYAELKGTQKKLYQQLERDMIAKYKDFKVKAPRTITQMIRLQQITGGHVPTEDKEMLKFECPKAELLDEFLSTWSKKKKLVIFARFIHELGLIEQVCKKRGFSCYVYNHGEAHLDKKFQEEEHPQISISQITKGIARTLTRGDTVVLFSWSHSHIVYRQCIGRVKSRGVFKKPITPVLLMTKDTIDEDINNAVIKKQSESQFVASFFNKLKERLTKS